MNGLPTLAVTGSTGVLGAMVASQLAGAGIAQRLLVRSPQRAPQLPAGTVLPFSYDDSRASEQALAGARLLFMVSAAESVDRVAQHRTFIDAARSAGVEHIVYTSFLGASPTATFTLARDHFATEEYIRSSGLDHTFLRDSLYLDFMEALVGEDGFIRGPAGDGRVAAVARVDVARTATAILRDPASHAGRTYDLTGPSAVTLSEVASILSRHRGRDIRFHDETLAEAYTSREKWAAPGWQNDAWVSTYTAIAAGEMAAVSDDVASVSGRPPLDLAGFLDLPT